jgi:prevent-host-death family protein
MDSEDMVPVGDASDQGVSKLVSRASEGRPVVLTKYGKPAAAVVNLEIMERLQHIEELEEDMRLLSLAWVRALTDSGKHYTPEELAAELDVDLDED